MEHLTHNDIALTRKVLLFAFNYEPNFLQKAFEGHGSMANHFESKFKGYYKEFGNGERAFLWLWNSMSQRHQLTLGNYISKLNV